MIRYDASLVQHDTMVSEHAPGALRTVQHNLINRVTPWHAERY